MRDATTPGGGRHSSSCVLHPDTSRSLLSPLTDANRRTRSLPSSPAVSGRKLSHENASLLETQNFLAIIEAIRKGPLHELDRLLVEAKSLQVKVLQATTPTVEKEALKRVETTYEKAGRAAQRATEALQELSSESSIATSSQADLRRQSLTGTSSKLQQAVRAQMQAQQEFREALEGKRSRLLRAAFPDASQQAVDAIAARSRSAASAIQDTVTLQPGSGDTLRTATAMMATHEDLSGLQELARSARMLKQAFEQAELMVSTQGEIFNDIESQVNTALRQTQQANEQLALTTQAQKSCRRRSFGIVGCVLVVLAVAVVVLVLMHKI